MKKPVQNKSAKNQQSPENHSKSFIGKELLIGVGVTLLCNLAGIYFVSELSNLDTTDFLKESLKNGSFGSVVALGALMDFLAFFVFLKKGQFYRVRGVLIGVLLAAFVVVYFKVL